MDMQSKAKKLIEMIQTAPVEWKPLGEVADYEQPTKYLVASKNYDDKFDTPVLTAGKTFILGYTDETEGIYKASGSPVIIFDDFTTANKWVDFDFKVKSSAMKIITSKNEQDVLLKYVYYWLNTLPNSLTDGDHKRQWISNFSNKEIPIPPLETQQKIVKILDKFTELEATLEATLEAELALRKRQYQYYRDFLLDFDNQIGGGADGYQCRLKDVVWKTLGEVTLPTENIKWKYTDKIYQYIDLTSVSREYKTITDTIAISANNAPSRAQKIVKEHDVIFATTRPTLQRFTIISKKFSGEIASTGYCVLRANCKEVLPKWIYYQISTERFNQYVEVNQSGSAYPAISDAKVKEFKIPIPSLPEQEKIVAILDKFDTLTHSISEGLPYEITLRRKQYEYYREQLLAFPKAA
ncbi:TPA: restriction endonuclease subunit S [Neisseria meningitidis]|uniref:restriction endonuclease subunit S n=1 Tax=Neisseria meningitidis TaxID=487 RepID=UPI00030B2E45|nr:restriction endonuclease subunit S [Neisseria meningitidis]MBH2266912.1 restriction endonuclease subunit S [Neisseria meningitidis]MBH2354392.1 restriction endonuclease subunit S [Neisseria meningitidis]MBH2410785.1 restriction endonuclease subunit S [Neisseria meningitidis]MBH2429493.1 restriction endonuclease subunit S [Neisseria meningitidis]MBH2502960.1 restriction endonuclease subunit S [Neisseria meningitidis]